MLKEAGKSAAPHAYKQIETYRAGASTRPRASAMMGSKGRAKGGEIRRNHVIEVPIYSLPPHIILACTAQAIPFVPGLSPFCSPFPSMSFRDYNEAGPGHQRDIS